MLLFILTTERWPTTSPRQKGQPRPEVVDWNEGLAGLFLFSDSVFARFLGRFSHSVHVDVEYPFGAEFFGEPSTANSWARW